MKSIWVMKSISVLSGAFVLSAFAADRPLNTVASVDLNKYQGKWYEIARLPNRFQRDCAGNVTATYRLRQDGKVDVLNECQENNQKTVKSAQGMARVASGAEQSKSRLEVRFAPEFLSFLPMVWGDYQIMSLGSDYEYALIGTPDRKYLWILSRTPQMQDALYQRLLKQAADQGFDTSKVIKTKQVWGTARVVSTFTPR